MKVINILIFTLFFMPNLLKAEDSLFLYETSNCSVFKKIIGEKEQVISLPSSASLQFMDTSWSDLGYYLNNLTIGFGVSSLTSDKVIKKIKHEIDKDQFAHDFREEFMRKQTDPSIIPPEKQRIIDTLLPDARNEVHNQIKLYIKANEISIIEMEEMEAVISNKNLKYKKLERVKRELSNRQALFQKTIANADDFLYRHGIKLHARSNNITMNNFDELSKHIKSSFKVGGGVLDGVSLVYNTASFVKNFNDYDLKHAWHTSGLSAFLSAASIGVSVLGVVSTTALSGGFVPVLITVFSILDAADSNFNSSVYARPFTKEELHAKKQEFYIESQRFAFNTTCEILDYSIKKAVLDIIQNKDTFDRDVIIEDIRKIVIKKVNQYVKTANEHFIPISNRAYEPIGDLSDKILEDVSVLSKLKDSSYKLYESIFYDIKELTELGVLMPFVIRPVFIVYEDKNSEIVFISYSDNPIEDIYQAIIPNYLYMFETTDNQIVKETAYGSILPSNFDSVDISGRFKIISPKDDILWEKALKTYYPEYYDVAMQKKLDCNEIYSDFFDKDLYYKDAALKLCERGIINKYANVLDFNKNITRGFFIKMSLLAANKCPTVGTTVKICSQEIYNLYSQMLDTYTFKDVDNENSYSPYVEYACKLGVIDCESDSSNSLNKPSFYPDKEINRAEATKIILKLLQAEYRRTPESSQTLCLPNSMTQDAPRTITDMNIEEIDDSWCTTYDPFYFKDLPASKKDELWYYNYAYIAHDYHIISGISKDDGIYFDGAKPLNVGEASVILNRAFLDNLK